MSRSAKSLGLTFLGVAALLAVAVFTFRQKEQAPAPDPAPAAVAMVSSPPPIASVSASAAGIVLIESPVEGTGTIETEIAQLQKVVNVERSRIGALDRLGWLFVAKARKDGDAGMYLRARACAEATEATDPSRRLDALLLRGHIHHQLHQFTEAEAIARELVASRGNPFDYAMLGDALFDRGEIDGAADAYQKMMNLRPGLPAYLRAGEMRWLHGDIDGCLDVMLMAVRAGSARQPEPTAWALSRLSHFLLLSDRLEESRAAAERALDLVPGYVPALGAKGRALMAQSADADAAPILTQAAEAVPQPAYQWPLYDCLRVLQRDKEAETLMGKIQATGEREDPRTYALFLATLGQQSETALTLARQELKVRGDIYTHDALALALLTSSAGNSDQVTEAREEIGKALALGTLDPRLFLHAALIHERAGDAAAALRFAHQAEKLRRTLLPSESDLLGATLDRLSTIPAQAVTMATDRKTPGVQPPELEPVKQTKNENN